MSMTTHTALADVQVLADLFRALAEPKRVRILNLIIEGVQCNCDLGEAMGLAPNLISHHLGVLRDAGLVEAERDSIDARWVYYTVNAAALAQIREALDAFFQPARIQTRCPTCGPRSECLRET